MMMKTAFVMGLILQAVIAQSLGSTQWKLHNEFQLGVIDGESAGFGVADGDPIATIAFDASGTKPDTPVSGWISMIDLPTDNLIVYVAKIIDWTKTGMLVIAIPALDDLLITLYLIRVDEDTYLYSYALGFDLERKLYLSAKGQKNYQIFVGSMKRVAK